jgi:hypothetical protein
MQTFLKNLSNFNQRWKKYYSDRERVVVISPCHSVVSALVPRAENSTSDSGEKKRPRRPWSEITINCART